MRRKIAIVGNGPIPNGYAEFIDKHDMVLRFNACSNYGSTGTKCDVIVLANTGAPARRFAENPDSINADALKATKQVWLARHPALVEIERCRHGADALSWIDQNEAIIGDRIQDKPWTYLSPKTWWGSMELLTKLGAPETAEPSTGMLAIYHLRTSWLRRLGLCRANLFGFTHRGWSGHPWDAERKFIDSASWIKRRD